MEAQGDSIAGHKLLASDDQRQRPPSSEGISGSRKLNDTLILPVTVLPEVSISYRLTLRTFCYAPISTRVGCGECKP